MSERLGLTAQFKDGLRVTDEPTMEVVKMVLTGKVNPDLVASINRLGGQSVGMSGEDGPSIIAEELDPGLGFVGRVTQINPEPITALLQRGYIPVIASIGLGFGAALGVAKARPNKTTVLVIGDGAFLMTMGELETVVRDSPVARANSR